MKLVKAELFIGIKILIIVVNIREGCNSSYFEPLEPAPVTAPLSFNYLLQIFSSKYGIYVIIHFTWHVKEISFSFSFSRSKVLTDVGDIRIDFSSRRFWYYNLYSLKKGNVAKTCDTVFQFTQWLNDIKNIEIRFQIYAYSM